jgi:hypothetical protein
LASLGDPKKYRGVEFYEVASSVQIAVSADKPPKIILLLRRTSAMSFTTNTMPNPTPKPPDEGCWQ